MISWLLKIGLVVTPFILAPGNDDIARDPKMAWALVFALAVGLTSIYQGALKPFKNKWALLLVGFCLVSFYMSPGPELKLFGVQSGRFWSWEPLYQGMVFLLFVVSVASLKIFRDEGSKILDVMVWCGTVMAALVVLQAFHIDQFFEHRFGTYGNMAGTLGNPTLVGPYLTIVVPLAFYRKKFYLAALMILATLLTRSDVALVGMLAALGAYVAFKSRKWFSSVAVLGVIVVVLVGGLYMTNPKFRQTCPDNERFLTWTQSVQDLTVPVMNDSKKIYAITGIGPGSFKYLFHMKHNPNNDNFLYAHNDFVQTLYELGVVGFLLFVGAIFCVFRGSFRLRGLPPMRRALLASLVGALASAGGIFIFQIGTHIYYVLTIVGLLCNDSLKESNGGPYV